jgi:NADPH-dependent curcumin reductase CurA
MSRVREIVLARPVAGPPVAADFEIVQRPTPAVDAGRLLVRSLYQSQDPYIGSRLRGRHMGEPAPAPGESLPGFCVGEVLESGDPAFEPGDRVVGEMGWVEVGLMPASGARKVAAGVPASAHLGVLGMPGLTAWAGVTQLAEVGPGDLVSVDAAAGPVGGTVGQLARLLGARAVGMARGEAKCALIRETYGFDAAVDLNRSDWIDAYTAETAPGPTVHFENVGLSVLMPAMQRLQNYGRVVLCGMAEHYHADTPPAQVPVGLIIGKRAAMMGLVVYDFYPRWEEWIALATPWIHEGRLAFVEDIAKGIEAAPAQFERLMRGENQGKALVQMSEA